MLCIKETLLKQVQRISFVASASINLKSKNHRVLSHEMVCCVVVFFNTKTIPHYRLQIILANTKKLCITGDNLSGLWAVLKYASVKVNNHPPFYMCSLSPTCMWRLPKLCLHRCCFRHLFVKVGLKHRYQRLQIQCAHRSKLSVSVSAGLQQ